MPLYMDRHNINGVTPEQLAEAHQKDLEVQGRHGTRYLNYWHDQSRGCVFCLVEAPSKDAATQVHREAHGLVAEDIIEVDPATVKAFFGDIAQTPPLMKIAPLDNMEAESAFRALLFTDLHGSTAMTHELGDGPALELVRTHNAIVREHLHAFAGREVKHTGDGLMACFASVCSAVECAIAIQRAFIAHNRDNPEHAMRLKIGLSAGEPVADDKDLFGATVQLAARLCALAQPEEIIAPSVVRDLCLGKKLTFLPRGKYQLKGFSQPVEVFEIDWAQVEAS